MMLYGQISYSERRLIASSWPFKGLSESYCDYFTSYFNANTKFLFFQALIDAHDKIGKIWLERGSGIDEKTALNEVQKDKTEASDLSPDQNGDMPVETVKVVGLRKVPGQPLGLTVSTVH